MIEGFGDIGELYDELETAKKRIEHLQRELAEERRSREEAQAFAWKFSNALREITKTAPFGKPQEIAREALGEK